MIDDEYWMITIFENKKEGVNEPLDIESAN